MNSFVSRRLLLSPFNCRWLWCLALFLLVQPTLAVDETRRPLDHSDYDRWNTISGRSISPDGNWVLFSVTSGKAEAQPVLMISSLSQRKQYTVPRGTAAEFSFDSRFVAYRINPDPEEVERLKKAKTPAEQLPKPKLQILELNTGQSFSVSDVRSFSMPEEAGGWIAYLMNPSPKTDSIKTSKPELAETYEVTPSGLKRPQAKPKLKKRESLTPPPAEPKPKPATGKPTEQEKEESEPESKPAETIKKKERPAGSVLVLRNLETDMERRFPDVISFRFAKNGSAMAFTTSVDVGEQPPEGGQKSDQPADSKTAAADAKGRDELTVDGAYVFDLQRSTLTKILSGTGKYEDLAFNEDGSRLAFLCDKDDNESESPSTALYLWQRGQKSAAKIVDEQTTVVPVDWWISSDSTLRFSEDDRRLFFATKPIPDEVLKQRKEKESKSKDNEDKEDDDKKDDDKKAKLDIWHWQDPLLQPQQLLQADRERRRDYRAVYDLRTRKVLQLATRQMPTVVIDHRSSTDVAVGTSNLPYQKSLSWDVQGFQDTYLVNLRTGDRELIIENSRANPRLSPEGKYATWWDGEQKKWFVIPTAPGAERTPREISAGINQRLDNELHDTPSLPRSYGSGGWLKDDAAFLVFDRFDIWMLDPTGQTPPVCLTGKLGRQEKIRFRPITLDPLQRAIDPAHPLMLSAFNETTKASGFYKVLLSEPESAKTGDDLAPPTSDLRPFQPRLLIMLDEQLSGLVKARNTDDVLFTRSTFRRCPDLWKSSTDFEKITRVSDINPQQDEYRWGTAELVSWKSGDGQMLDGLLYKPDGFDPEKKYPLMVYFYERNSDNLHSYYTPAAGRSIINHSFYVSRGYLLFVPDIPYKTGEPGESAYRSVVPGVQHLLDQGFVDAEKIGMQGHSWGGYQTAYLVTKTDMFACAESGAPVSNMTSAYGGIRWSSGMSRMFQYERTQSRIGADLWSAREKYIANSPLFFADQVNTPILILHNDEDGAVPWYQGIEFFVALRRLGKPAWLLNYNGNPHWVMGDANRRDFAIRMQQFFDHYLMDAPEPEWMAVGVPAVDKGEKFGLELLEPIPESEPGEE